MAPEVGVSDRNSTTPWDLVEALDGVIWWYAYRLPKMDMFINMFKGGVQ